MLVCFTNDKYASFKDPEAGKTKEAIEFFTQLGNRYNISHVAQVEYIYNVAQICNTSHVAQLKWSLFYYIS